MRSLMIVLALAATPFVASVAQGNGKPGRPHHGENRARRPDARAGAASTAAAPGDCNEQGQHEGEGCASAPPVAGAEIHGRVFQDLNANGIQDPGEAGVPGWIMMIDGTTLTVVTDVNGDYAFVSLSPGSYTVCPQARALFFPVWPQSGPVCSFGFGQPATLVAGQKATGLNFGVIGGF